MRQVRGALGQLRLETGVAEPGDLNGVLRRQRADLLLNLERQAQDADLLLACGLRDAQSSLARPPTRRVAGLCRRRRAAP